MGSGTGTGLEDNAVNFQARSWLQKCQGKKGSHHHPAEKGMSLEDARRKKTASPLCQFAAYSLYPSHLHRGITSLFVQCPTQAHQRLEPHRTLAHMIYESSPYIFYVNGLKMRGNQNMTVEGNEMVQLNNKMAEGREQQTKCKSKRIKRKLISLIAFCSCYIKA